ncbi:hypothetical protein Lgee_0258 [Legionella geestiana]|uniref:Uncharacterized protein n=1 Tax=Legionella geestiana TaxID=45065 RepID=A0A0W0U8B5_9GAMM|nr:hypothetical protein [Legionella geestiana]KTD04228.1 hypothetical protein Lgee_0258 [Legionella geestiana]QDQ40741.1 hypothetical protein E3226_010200 [Legionella geestiana]STX53667.1 Uncharacterised protein [Legionella geestiana]
MVKVSRETLEASLILLEGSAQIPSALKSLIAEADFTDVFPERAEFLSWYQQLPQVLRLEMLSLMQPAQRKRLFDGEGVLAFFKAFHTPAEALKIIEAGILEYDFRQPEPQNLADWLSWFPGMQTRLFNVIKPHAASVFRGVSFSEFLERLSGNSVLSTFNVDWLAGHIQIPGNPDIILKHYEGRSYDWWRIQGLFLTQKWPGYSEDTIREKLATLDIQRLVVHACECIVANRGRIKRFCNRLIEMPDAELLSLIQGHTKQLKHAHALLDYLLSNHPRREKLLAAIQEIKSFDTFFECRLPVLRERSHTIHVAVEALKTLTDFLQSYQLFVPAGIEQSFLDAIPADKMRSLFQYQSTHEMRTFFQQLFEARAYAFLCHPLGLVVVETPLRMGCFIDTWEQNMKFLQTLFRGNFKFHDVLHLRDSGGLAEFLEGYRGDFPLFLDKSNVLPFSWVETSITRDFFAVHQRVKHDSQANALMMRWMLERPQDLQYYTEDALFDVLNRLPDKPLESWLEKASAELTARPPLEDVVARILEARGANPAIGRLVCQRYYPDVSSPFWTQNGRWMALFAWLESPEHIAEFMMTRMTSASGDSTLFTLETFFREFMMCHGATLQRISALQRFEDVLLTFCRVLAAQESIESFSAAFLTLLYLALAILGGALSQGVHFAAQMPLRFTFTAQLPVFFPRLPPHELLLHANVFFAKCERLRALPTLSSSAFFARDAASQSAPEEASSMPRASSSAL